MNNNSIQSNAARDAGQFIILCEGRGDYLTGLGAGGEIKGGSEAQAIRYTAEEARELVASLGRGFSVEAIGLTDKRADLPAQTTLGQFIAASHLNPSLIRAVVRQMGGWKSFSGSAADICRGGIDGEFNGFIYTRETVQFALRNITAIRTMAGEQARDMALGTVEMIQGFGCFRHDSQSADNVGFALWGTHTLDTALEDHSTILNALAWYAAEEVARSYNDLTENA